MDDWGDCMQHAVWAKPLRYTGQDWMTQRCVNRRGRSHSMSTISLLLSCHTLSYDFSGLCVFFTLFVNAEISRAGSAQLSLGFSVSKLIRLGGSHV